MTKPIATIAPAATISTALPKQLRANNPRPVFGEAEQRAFMRAAGLPTPNEHGVPTALSPTAPPPSPKVIPCSRCEGAGVVETRDCWSGGVTLNDEEECTTCDGLGRVLDCRADELPELTTCALRLRTIVSDAVKEGPDRYGDLRLEVTADELVLLAFAIERAQRAAAREGAKREVLERQLKSSLADNARLVDELRTVRAERDSLAEAYGQQTVALLRGDLAKEAS